MTTNLFLLSARHIDELKQFINDNFVAPQRPMDGFGLAVFKDSMKVVPHELTLKGGPDYARIEWPPLTFSTFIVQSIDTGGAEDLVEMMQVLNLLDPKKKDWKRLMALTERFANRALDLQDQWLLGRNDNPTRH